MALFTATNEATTNAFTGLIDTFIALVPTSGFSVKLRRVRISVPGPPPTTEVSLRVNVTRKVALGTGGISSAGVAVRAQSPALSSSTTVVVKNGTAVFGAGSSIASLIAVALNQRATYEWIPRDDSEVIDSGQQGLSGALQFTAGGILGIDISSSGVSTLVRAELEYEE